MINKIISIHNNCAIRCILAIMKIFQVNFLFYFITSEKD